ncbi:hypothetical protein CBS101457_003596 [Exobasidium rhododendri]|nr:hypothetical protein CBS101457_003596 [Exobasidium rhododendri]
MSLLVDPDYAIHALRLAYLRRIDDHAGPRVITLPFISHLAQSERHGLDGIDANTPKASTSNAFVEVIEEFQHSSSPSIGGLSNSSVLTPLPANSHVVVAGLNDARYQPELARLHSPKLNSLLLPQQDSLSAFPGNAERRSTKWSSQRSSSTPTAERSQNAGKLKYTTTILGPGRSGALGMRVNGRRAMSGDVPRRGGRALKESDFVEEEDDSEEMIREPSESAAASNVGKERQASAVRFSKDVDGRSQRSSSFQMPNQKPHSLSSSPIGGLRNRSSSQPLQTAYSEALKGKRRPSEDDGVFLDDSQLISHSMVDLYDPLRKHKHSIPPLRPPRRIYRSDAQSGSRQDDTSEGSTTSSRLSDVNLPVVESSIVPSRNRGASEGDASFLQDSSVEARGKEAVQVNEEQEEATEEVSTEVESREQYHNVPSIDRLDSSSTVFSLASPPTSRKRGLSDNWLRGDAMNANLNPNPNNLSPLSANTSSFASYRLTALRRESSLSRTKTNDSSPLSRKTNLSGSPEAQDGSNAGGLHPSGYSSNLLDQSLDFTLSDGAQDSLHSSTSHLAQYRGEADEMYNGSNLSNPPLRSALGLHTSWDGEIERQIGDLEKSLNISPKDERESGIKIHQQELKKPNTARKQSSRSHRPAGYDAQQKQEWFASLKADSETVAKRFETRPQRSGVSALMNKHSEGPSNPFAATYKGVAGGNVSSGSSTLIEVYFPFASHQEATTSKETRSGANAIYPKKKSMSLNVRKDATIEGVIGYSLYCYTEEDWKPRLEEGSITEPGMELDWRLSTIGWTLRIVEDGEVDDDYPAIDRTLTVGKFGADELAICEATAAQVKQHLSASTLVPRKAAHANTTPQTSKKSVVPVTEVSSTLHANASLGGSTVRTATATANNNPAVGSLVNIAGTPISTSSAIKKSDLAPLSTSLFLRILITPNSEVKYKTTLQVPSDTYLADVLETICRKRQLANIEEWALVVAEKNVVVPLDRTVESLQGNYDLALVRRQDLGKQAGTPALTSYSTDPNTSIFKRMSQPVQLSRYNAAKELASTYKTYTVNRKQASFLGRHERNLTIDGDWIHIIPTDTKAFQAQSGTSSFPITAILSCTQSRLLSSFKLIITRVGNQKRYDFEAENPATAAEIVEEINLLIKRTK